MQIIPLLVKELDDEVATLRKFLELVPGDKFRWKPHKKSMSMQLLAVHLAEIPGWIDTALTTNELDFAKTPYEPTPVKSTKELLDLLEETYKKGKTRLNNAHEDDLLPNWTMRSGDQVYWVFTKYEVIRHALGQIIHHRAQLGVYFRLLDIAVPPSFGPTADDQME